MKIREAPAKYAATAPRPDAVLSKATVRAAEQLGLTQARLARVLGLSPATASRLASGDWRIPKDGKIWELATAFLRLFRSLSAITGGDMQAMRTWMHTPNTALGGEPAQLIGHAEGLIRVLHYLDAVRGRV